MTSKTAALLIGVVFIAVGLLGFIDNPIVGTSANAIFHADTVHNYVHIVSGALFVLIALMSPRSAAGFMKLFGVVYLLIGILGFFAIGADGMGKVLGFLHVNGADNFLHIGLGILIFLAGTVTRKV
ncbi:MAG TPA: DUF4383 domain-containing protein [Chitinophagaceae bacterium]|nr:DUF4383 domain-containing protein [Chitinophagaceae bacterium]